MQQPLKDKINGYGAVLRFVTPILIAITGFLIIRGIDTIEDKIDDLEIHFVNHLMHHQQLEVGYERRLSGLEKDTEHCDEKILQFHPREVR